MRKLLILLLLTILSYSAYSQSGFIGRSRAEVTQMLYANNITYQTANDGHIAYRMGEIYLYSYFDKNNKCILHKSISGVQSEEDKQWIVQNFCGWGEKETTKQGTV